MHFIDAIAASSKFQNIHPLEKGLFCALLFFFSQAAPNFILPALVFSCVPLLLILAGGLALKQYLRLLCIPALFIFLAGIPLLVSLQPGSSPALISLQTAGFYLEITKAQCLVVSLLCLKAFASLSAFYFFILTTPFCGLEYLLKKARLPQAIRELILLTYRYIFVFLHFFLQIKQAQKLRGGYRGIYRSLNSLACSLVVLFRRMLHFGVQSSLALQTRGCRGEIRFADTGYVYAPRNWLFMAMFVLFGVLLLAGIR